MKPIALIVLSAFVVGCSASSGDGIEGRIKKYMADTVTTAMHDPSSYEFVNMKLDTFFGREYYKNLERYQSADTSLYSQESLAEDRKMMSDLQSKKQMDSIIYIRADVNYRAKNVLGVKVMNKAVLKYHPQQNAIEFVE